MEKVENPLTVEQIVELVGLMQQSAQKGYEESADTLERKYNEGQADAFRTALDYFERALGEYQRGFDEGENQGGRNVLDYLSEIFDELDETDIWAEYMGEEEEEEKHQMFCPVCGSVGCVIDHEERTCNLCGDEILDLELGAIVSPFGECCGDCVNEIKGAK